MATWVTLCSLCGAAKVEDRPTAEGHDPRVWHRASHGFCPPCAQRIQEGFRSLPLELLIDHYRDETGNDFAQEVLERLLELQNLRLENAWAEKNAQARAERIAQLERKQADTDLRQAVAEVLARLRDRKGTPAEMRLTIVDLFRLKNAMIE